MADDALTRKDAEMGGLTRERIEELSSRGLGLDKIEFQQLCSLALRALSLESVREEALDQGDKLMQAKRSGYDEGRWMGLEEAAKVCDNLVGGRSHSGDAIAERLATAIRALQHAPARVAEGGTAQLTEVERLIAKWRDAPVKMMLRANHVTDLLRDALHPSAPESPAKEQPGEQNAAPQEPRLEVGAPTLDQIERKSRGEPAAAAPDVAGMVKRLREGVTVLDEPFHHQAIADTMEDAAAMIEKLWADLDILGTVIRTGFVPPEREWTSEIARKTALRALELRQVSDAMVNRFLTWPLPESVDSDFCVTKDYGQRDGWVKVPLRYGTNLLTADEARQMLEYVLISPPPERP